MNILSCEEALQHVRLAVSSSILLLAYIFPE